MFARPGRHGTGLNAKLADPLHPGPQCGAHAVERIPGAASMTQGRCCTRWRVRSSLAPAKAALLHEPGSGEIGLHASGSEMS